jgi:hypothetical protein
MEMMVAATITMWTIVAGVALIVLVNMNGPRQK